MHSTSPSWLVFAIAQSWIWSTPYFWQRSTWELDVVGELNRCIGREKTGENDVLCPRCYIVCTEADLSLQPFVRLGLALCQAHHNVDWFQKFGHSFGGDVDLVHLLVFFEESKCSFALESSPDHHMIRASFQLVLPCRNHSCWATPLPSIHGVLLGGRVLSGSTNQCSKCS